MIWFGLALGSALGAGTADALSKKALTQHPVPVVSWGRAFWCALWLMPFLWMERRWLSVPTVWIVTFLAMPLEIVASLSYQTAMKTAPISLTVPYMAFTPVFLIGIGWVFLGEWPSPLGMAGIFLITSGAAFLQWDENAERRHVLRFIPRHKGSWLALLTSFLYAVTSVLVKKGVLASSHFFFPGFYLGILSLCLLPILWKEREWKQESRRAAPTLATLGLVEGAGLLVQFAAFPLTKIAYVMGVKRLSLLVAVGAAAILFKEKTPRSRLFAVGLMVTGAFLTAFAQ